MSAPSTPQKDPNAVPATASQTPTTFRVRRTAGYLRVPGKPPGSPPSPEKHSSDSMGEPSVSAMSLPPSAIGVSEDDMAKEMTEDEVETGVLIPEEIPPSRLLYVLTTSEGRDKVMKTSQYVLKLLIWLLQSERLWPPGSVALFRQAALRFAANIQSIRDGRALFKLGRWLVTFFHVEVALSLLISKLFPLLALQARRRAAGENCELPRRASCWQLMVEALRRRSQKASISEGGENQTSAEDEAELLLAKRYYENFSVKQMVLMMLRCVFSIMRNVLRDYMFVRSNNLFGAPALQSARRSHIQTWANRAWFAVSLIDCTNNALRLFDTNWLGSTAKPDSVIEGRCTTEAKQKKEDRLSQYAAAHFINKKRYCHFPAANFDIGCPAPTTPQFFDAVPPQYLPLICGECRSICVPKSTPSGSVSDLPGEEHQHERHRSHHVATMALPRLIRQMYAIGWCFSKHENLRYTVYLQLKYFCDLYLSCGYVFGNFESKDVEGDSTPLEQHMHLSATVAGLVSALTALNRVYLSATLTATK